MTLTAVRASELGNMYLTKPSSKLNPQELCELKNYIDTEYEKISVPVRYVDYRPYDDAEDMQHQVERWGYLLIFNGGSESELLGEFHNLRFRAVHDWRHLQYGADFSMSGEWQAYLHALTTTTSRVVKNVLFSEIVLQAAAYSVLGDFPEEQKLVFLNT